MRTQGSSSTAVARRDGRLHQRSGGTHASAFCQAIRADRRGRWRWELRRLSGSMLCIGAGAPNLHLAGDARKYCGDLPSGRRSLFNTETRGEQRARELGAPHMHMRIGLLRTFRSAARNRNQDRSAPADCPFRVESRVLMATHRVSARAHPRFDRHTPPKTWQTCWCESSVTGFFNTEVPPSFYPLIKTLQNTVFIGHTTG